jgi:hypothetical protein
MAALPRLWTPTGVGKEWVQMWASLGCRCGPSLGRGGTFSIIAKNDDGSSAPLWPVAFSASTD